MKKKTFVALLELGGLCSIVAGAVRVSTAAGLVVGGVFAVGVGVALERSE